MALQSTSVSASPLRFRQLEDEPDGPAALQQQAPHDTAEGAPGASAPSTDQGGAHEAPSGPPEDAPQANLLDRLPPPQSREPAAYMPFMGRAAWNARRPATALDDLPEPDVRAQTPTTAAAADAAPTPPAPAAPAAPAEPATPATPTPTPQAPTTNPSGGYVGERPVDQQWLQDREAALLNVRADYEAQRAQAQAQAPAFGANAPGWVDATLATDESGQTRSASGAATVFVPQPGAQATVVGYDEGGPVYGATPGRTLEFNEEAFAAHYRAQGGPALQALARLYDRDPATLFSQQPQLWQLTTQDHAVNAGPPPPGRAMGDPQQLGMLDLYMSDPQVQGLINSYGGSVAPATSGIAQEQVRLYGQARYEQLTRLSQAMQAVRNTYSAAMAQAESSGSGVGWVERQRTVTVSDESGASRTEAVFLSDESGARTPLVERVFDPDAFTRWYMAQDGQANRAFADFYGQSHTQYSTDESGVTRASSISFDNTNWTMQGVGGAMSHRELVSLDPNNAPRLNNDSAVGFDLEAGWATHPSNIHQDRDWFETVLQVAAVAVVSYFTAGAASGWAAAAGWGATGSAVIAGAAAGAAGSLVSGAMSGNLAFKDILRGALAGGLSGGLLAEFGGTVAANYGPAGTVALRTTVQGGIQALLGGSFRDGALAGFASGLADVTSAGMNANIDRALEAGTMDAVQATAARSFVRVLGSAVRALGNPDDPQYAFASAFVGSVVNGALDATQPSVTAPATIQTVFDDDGYLMPGVVDITAPWEQQVAQMQALLERQGMDPATAARVMGDYQQRVQDDAFDTFVTAQPLPVLVASVGWTPDVRNARDVIGEIENRIADGSLQGREIGHAIEDSYQAYLRLGAMAASRDTPPTVDEERAASRLISLIGDLGQVAQDQGQTLTAEQQQLVLQSRALQAQNNLPQIYGTATGGGILALRQAHRIQALQAWAARPSLRHPDQVVGRTDGGPGQWVYTPRRSGGQDYQEQVSGVPRGVEYQVRGVNLDGYDATRRVAIDSKDWQGYPPPGTDFWQRGVVREASGQLRALEGTGVRLEWHVSTPQAAEQLGAAFRDAAIRVPALKDVTIIVVPRKGP
jgi:hypothetical protein